MGHGKRTITPILHSELHILPLRVCARGRGVILPRDSSEHLPKPQVQHKPGFLTYLLQNWNMGELTPGSYTYIDENPAANVIP